jgi:hypothetical protein
MVPKDSGAVELTAFRLFCIAFVLSFSLFMTNLAALQWISLYLEQRPEAPASDEGADEEPRLALYVSSTAALPSFVATPVAVVTESSRHCRVF